MVSISDGRGCVGISHQADAAVHSTIINGVFNTAGAITNAAASLKAGDVMLIELQAIGGPNGKYVAMQFWSDIFSAIKATVGSRQRKREFRSGRLQRDWIAEGQWRDRRRCGSAADQSCRFRRFRS